MRAAPAVYRQNMFEGMSPERITLALYDGALMAIKRAQQASAEGQVAARGEQLSKALAIIGELAASLAMDKGGELAENLRDLYEFSTFELLDASLHDDVEKMKNVEAVIQEIRDGWAQMCDEVAKNRPANAPGPTPPKLASGGAYM